MIIHAKKVVPEGQHGLMYTATRTGLGNVFYMSTNDETRVNTLNFIPHTVNGPSKSAEDLALRQQLYTDQRVTALTDEQSWCKSWFFQRPGLVTSTGLYEATKSMGKYSVANRQALPCAGSRDIADLIGIKSYNPARLDGGAAGGEAGTQDFAEDPELFDASQYTEADLNGLNAKQLEGILSRMGRPKSGKKAEKIARILEVLETTHPTQALVKCWFIQPLKSKNMSAGSKNEANISRHLPALLKEHSDITLEAMVHPGLVVDNENPAAGDSIDNVGRGYEGEDSDMVTGARESKDGEEKEVEMAGSDISRQPRKWFGCEYKTLTTPTTEAAGMKKAGELGYVYRKVHIGVGDHSLFKLHCSSGPHRAQLLEHAGVYKVKDQLYVVAGLTKIIRVVHFVFNDEVLNSMTEHLKVIKEEYMGFIWSPDECTRSITPTINLRSFDDIPDTIKDFGWCKDRWTFVQALEKMKAIRHAIDQRGEPFPPIKHILPYNVCALLLCEGFRRVKGTLS
jgi:hypothetical protein